MNQVEIDFFEEYRAVERICSDMYGAKNGVTEYILHMEDTDSCRALAVDGWNESLKMLKHLRWLRNQIAHGGTDYEVTADDLQHIKGFHQALLNADDPLARLRKAEREQREKQQTVMPQTALYTPAQRADDTPSFGLAAVGFLLPIVGIIFYFVFESKKPLMAKSAVKGALTGFLFKVVCAIVIAVLYVAGISFAYDQLKNNPDFHQELTTDAYDYDESFVSDDTDEYDGTTDYDSFDSFSNTNNDLFDDEDVSDDSEWDDASADDNE